ncbi:MAG: DNA cytosine methyltransferase [Coleofasciculaceae cyanobacterium SM2_1_6]|nr:DNA cytosine methyltransferase [Coleofasciculaceae cyanobacterium SM2_1_6]
MKKTFIDLFSGAGGMSCGLEMASWHCLLGIDHDQAAIETFQYNHPQAQSIAGDIREISNQQIQALIDYQKVDLICGGPPCQGFSTIGQNDCQDERNFLFIEFLRIVEALVPDYIIVENVTGLLSKRNENVLKKIITSFTDLGYTIDVKVLSAHHYGVPEKRRRTIFLGNRFGVRNLYPDKIFKDSEQDHQDLPLPRTVGWAFENLLAVNGKKLNHDIDRSQIANDLEKERISYIPEGKSVRYEKDQLAYLPERLWFNVDWQNIHEERFREAKLNRLNRQDCANTINTSRTTYYHPIENRYLTAREAAAIQSFPANYFFCGTLTQQWRQIGNAVPPLLAKALGESILALDSRKNNMEETTSIEDIQSIRAKAFSYKESMFNKHRQLTLF